MPTKILVLETPAFKLGANVGDQAELLDPSAFPARIAKHSAEGGNDVLFVLAPEELRYQPMFNEAIQGPGNVSTAFFGRTEDAIRFLPIIFRFASDSRSMGVKDSLAKGTTVYTENVFNGKGIGMRLDPVFSFARRNLPTLAATNAWGSIQSLVFHGLQNLPQQGEAGSGEKIDVQVGADDKVFIFTVRFDLAPEHTNAARMSPLVSLARSAAGVYECRYLADGRKIEFNCLFFRDNGPARAIEIQTYHRKAALEAPDAVRDYQFQSFGSMENAPAVETKAAPARGGFKKKFSAQVGSSTPLGDDAVLVKGNVDIGDDATLVTGNFNEKEKVTHVRDKGGSAALAESTVIVSGSAGLGAKETIFKGGATNAELEQKIHALEITLQQKDAMIAKINKDLAAANDPSSKRDVLTNIKDSQSEALKQSVKALEVELEEAKGREKELMKMVDKAVQMKDEAAKKIKELDVKLKQTGGQKGSKEQMLEKQVEEQKRQNKELSGKVSDLMAKLQSMNKRAA